MPQKKGCERGRGGGDPGAAGADERPGRLDAGGAEHRLDLVRPAPDAVAVGVDEAPKGDVHAAGDVAPAAHSPRLGIGAGEAARGAVVHHLLGRMLEVRQHLLEAPHELGPEAGLEACLRRPDRPIVERPALGAPLGEAAVEHADVVMAEDAQGPPDPGRAERALGVVDDERVRIADAERTRHGRELLRGGAHVRQAGVCGTHPIEVEADRTWNVAARVLRVAVAAAAGQVEARVEHTHPRIAEACREPPGVDQGMGSGGHRRSHASQEGTGRPLLRRKVGLNSLL